MFTGWMILRVLDTYGLSALCEKFNYSLTGTQVGLQRNYLYIILIIVYVDISVLVCTYVYSSVQWFFFFFCGTSEYS